MKRQCLNPGRLNQFCEIQTQKLTTTGEPAQTWQSIRSGRNVPVEILAVGGGERIRGQQIEATATTMLMMHFRDDVSPRMRVRVGDRVLGIVRSYDPDGQRRELVLQCKEIA